MAQRRGPHRRTGVRLPPRPRRPGLATEAAGALLDWGFGAFGLHRVVARCHADNEPSARLMARLGMRREARHVRSYRFRDGWADQLVYAILADEWRGR
ncbi:GNAT family protein [Micromonospora sp. BRA006-A]|nr:GNAT family protein [Micromonospora sp. BRA006-A]